MDARLRLTLLVLAVVLFGAPAAAGADTGWSCSARTGWVAANGQRAEAATLAGSPCPQARAAAGSAAGLAADGEIAVDGGAAAETTDTRKPQATVNAKTLAIRSPDGKLAIDVSGLTARAQGLCDTARQPSFTSSGSPGKVILNGRPIDTSREYSEPGVGVNGAPLFGKLTLRFGELAKQDSGISRREVHVIVTDRDGATVFEAVAGEVAVGRSGPVCDPPPICPPGQEPQAGRCVNVTVAPLPQSPPPVSPGVSPPAVLKPAPGGCRDANALTVSGKRLAAATLCLMNVERRKQHLSRLRANGDLRRAAAEYAAAMVKGRFFAHGDLLGRILHSGYLGRFGDWRLGENLGWGWGRGASPRALLRAWMRSPSHRRNILGRRFRDAGIATLRGSPGRRKPGSITYVVDFGGLS